MNKTSLLFLKSKDCQESIKCYSQQEKPSEFTLKSVVPDEIISYKAKCVDLHSQRFLNIELDGNGDRNRNILPQMTKTIFNRL